MAESKFGTFKVDIDIQPFQDAIRRIGRGASALGVAFEAAEGVPGEVQRLVDQGIDLRTAPPETLAEMRAADLRMATEMIAHAVLVDEAIAKLEA